MRKRRCHENFSTMCQFPFVPLSPQRVHQEPPKFANFIKTKVLNCPFSFSAESNTLAVAQLFCSQLFRITFFFLPIGKASGNWVIILTYDWCGNSFSRCLFSLISCRRLLEVGETTESHKYSEMHKAKGIGIKKKVNFVPIYFVVFFFTKGKTDLMKIHKIQILSLYLHIFPFKI